MTVTLLVLLLLILLPVLVLLPRGQSYFVIPSLPRWAKSFPKYSQKEPPLLYFVNSLYFGHNFCLIPSRGKGSRQDSWNTERCPPRLSHEGSRSSELGIHHIPSSPPISPSHHFSSHQFRCVPLACIWVFVNLYHKQVIQTTLLRTQKLRCHHSPGQKSEVKVSQGKCCAVSLAISSLGLWLHHNDICQWLRGLLGEASFPVTSTLKVGQRLRGS